MRAVASRSMWFCMYVCMYLWYFSSSHEGAKKVNVVENLPQQIALKWSCNSLTKHNAHTLIHIITLFHIKCMYMREMGVNVYLRSWYTLPSLCQLITSQNWNYHLRICWTLILKEQRRTFLLLQHNGIQLVLKSNVVEFGYKRNLKCHICISCLRYITFLRLAKWEVLD